MKKFILILIVYFCGLWSGYLMNKMELRKARLDAIKFMVEAVNCEKGKSNAIGSH